MTDKSTEEIILNEHIEHARKALAADCVLAIAISEDSDKQALIADARFSETQDPQTTGTLIMVGGIHAIKCLSPEGKLANNVFASLINALKIAFPDHIPDEIKEIFEMLD